MSGPPAVMLLCGNSPFVLRSNKPGMARRMWENSGASVYPSQGTTLQCKFNCLLVLPLCLEFAVLWSL